MFDYGKYVSLAPCLIKGKLEQSKDILRADSAQIKRFFVRGKAFRKYSEDLDSVETWQDFHSRVLAGNLVPAMMKKTVKEFECFGLENLRKDRKYLFVSNHRDIALDSIFVGYALIQGGCSFLQPVLGSNLMTFSKLAAWFVLCGGVVIDRELPPREMYAQSQLLSSYIFDAIESDYSSIWIAGGAGRSKDGIDTVKNAVMKMIFLSKMREMTIPEMLERLQIVPVAISYEYDPNDIVKSYAVTNEGGGYKKSTIEDLVSILRSIKKNKGGVSVVFRKPIPFDFEKSEDVSAYIEDEVNRAYRLYPVNYYAYDVLNGTQRFADRYKALKCRMFFFRLKRLSAELRDNVLRYYANAVETKIRLGEEV